MKINKTGKVLIEVGIVVFLVIGISGLIYTSLPTSVTQKTNISSNKVSTSTKTSSNINKQTSNNTKNTNTKPTLQITKVETKSTYKSSSDYEDVNITVYNNGDKNINYVKINLYYKDKNGNILRSDWTNDSSCIKPNANQIITETTKFDGWDNVTAEIAEYN